MGRNSRVVKIRGSKRILTSDGLRYRVAGCEAQQGPGERMIKRIPTDRLLITIMTRYREDRCLCCKFQQLFMYVCTGVFIHPPFMRLLRKFSMPVFVQFGYTFRQPEIKHVLVDRIHN